MKYVAYLKLGRNPVSSRNQEDFCMEDDEWIDFCDCNDQRVEVTSDPDALYLDIRCPITGMEFYGISREEVQFRASSK